MHYSLATSVAPAAEPLTRAEAKAQLRVDHDDENTLIDALIKTAREWAENYCRRSFVSRTLVLRMDCFPAEIRLPRGPVRSVTSVEYVDVSGTTTTLGASNYQVDIYALPGRIRLVSGATWPQIKVGQINGVVVTYVAGYAPGDTSPTDHAENVPLAVKQAMLCLIGGWYQNREHVVAQALAEAPMAVKALLAPYEIRDFTLGG